MEKYYVSGCIEIEGTVGHVEDEKAEFFTLYERKESELSHALLDCVDRLSVEAAMAIYIERDAHLVAEMVWEKTMMETIGEDGVGSVKAAFEKLQSERDSLQEQVRALAAENSIQDFIISAVKDLVCESRGVAGWHLNGDIASWDKALPELKHSETPATDAALREIRAQAVDSFSEDCKVKSSKESHVFWMDASSAAEEYAARIRSGEQP